MLPPIDPTLLTLGPVTIHWYGILVVTGILLGATVAAYLARRAGHDPADVWDMLLAAVVLGIVGARLEYVLTQPHLDYYRFHPEEAFYIWRGGLRIFGAILGGMAGVLIYTRLRKLNPLTFLDFAAPGMALGHAIGRWGNFINLELYGPPTTLPWGLDIPAAYRLAPYNDLVTYPASTRFHPAFLYESLLNLAICLLLVWASEALRRRLKPGDIVLAYLALYSIVRYGMDFLRTDGTSAQLLSLVLLSVALTALAARHLLQRRAATSPPT